MQKHICQVSSAFLKKILLSTSLFSTDVFLFTFYTYVQIQCWFVNLQLLNIEKAKRYELPMEAGILNSFCHQYLLLYSVTQVDYIENKHFLHLVKHFDAV